MPKTIKSKSAGAAESGDSHARERGTKASESLEGSGSITLHDREGDALGVMGDEGEAVAAGVAGAVLTT